MRQIAFLLRELKPLDFVWLTVCFICSRRRPYLIVFGVLAGLLCQSDATGQNGNPQWDTQTLGIPPKWERLQQPVSCSTNVTAVFFSSLPFNGKPARVFAWLGIPPVKLGEKVPAMVLVHGGGGTAFGEWVRLWVQRGYAAIAIDTCGQVPVGNYGRWVRDEQGGPSGWGGFEQIDRPFNEQWTYHAVADIILAHSLIRSLPEVDSERTGITGISWGGYLTCIVAGADSRFKFAAPVYGCGFYLDTVFAGDLGRLTPGQRECWVRWWDPAQHLSKASMPFLWVTGAKDHFYPLDALQRSYQLPPGARTLTIRAQMSHGQGEGEAPREILVFADSVLKKGVPLPRIISQGREGTNVWATYSSKIKVLKAELNYTQDTANWENRKWQTIPANLTATNVTAALPLGRCVYYLNITDERSCVVSSEHRECNLSQAGIK